MSALVCQFHSMFDLDGRNPAVQHIEAEGLQATHAVRPSQLGPMALVDPNATLAARVRGVRYLL
jgi:hypothetical protein